MSFIEATSVHVVPLADFQKSCVLSHLPRPYSWGRVTRQDAASHPAPSAAHRNERDGHHEEKRPDTETHLWSVQNFDLEITDACDAPTQAPPNKSKTFVPSRCVYKAGAQKKKTPSQKALVLGHWDVNSREQVDMHIHTHTCTLFQNIASNLWLFRGTQLKQKRYFQ